jgi:hypothetical protein
MSMIKCIEGHYEDTFESVHLGLTQLADKNLPQAKKIIRGILKSLYVRQGNDWTGRGALGNAEVDASIAAYECILADLAANDMRKAD